MRNSFEQCFASIRIKTLVFSTAKCGKEFAALKDFESNILLKKKYFSRY
jgi:hypothetical protein